MNDSFRGPLVTAIIITYNRPGLVRRAVQSVLAQGYEPLEIIVVEDGSDSGVKAWLNENGHSEKVRYVRHDRNRGLAAARNTGLRLARGEYVSYLDDDDEWLPEKIWKQVEFAERQDDGYDVICCGIQLVDLHGETTRIPRMSGRIRSQIGLEGLDVIPDNCGLFLRKSLIKISGYDDSIRSHTEYGLWMRMAKWDLKACHVDEHLVTVHRDHTRMMTTDYEMRAECTDLFLKKWAPEWDRWFGAERADRIRSDFVIVMFMFLGESSGCGGNIPFSVRAYGRVIRESPLSVSTYARLACSLSRILLRKSPFYGPLRCVWRRTVLPDSGKRLS